MGSPFSLRSLGPAFAEDKMRGAINAVSVVQVSLNTRRRSGILKLKVARNAAPGTGRNCA